MSSQMLHLVHSSVAVYSRIRDAFVDSIEACRPTDPGYAHFSGSQMHYYSSRCQSVNLLLQDWKLWDCDILMRSALECATRFLFVSVANGPERSQRIQEYTISLNEIEDILRSQKAKTAAANAGEGESAMLFGGATLSPERETELRAKWPQSKRKALKQKWSFSEMVRVLEKFSEPTLDLTKYGSLLHSYGISSHLIHADQTAMNLMTDRATRDPKERRLMERAHFARLAVQQTSLFFICWRAMERAIGSTKQHRSLVEALLELHEEANKYHHEYACSQMHLYKSELHP
jgi:Family of unknown function (DUF5677)